MKIEGYTFDSVSKTCTKFSDGGCGLSQNGFEHQDSCEETCGKFRSIINFTLILYVGQINKKF